jgi:hypothetical protein
MMYLLHLPYGMLGTLYPVSLVTSVDYGAIRLTCRQQPSMHLSLKI